jgi:adenine phosphoribosyltransferase
MNLKDYIKDVPNYPKEGILFKDITPLLLDKDAFNFAIDEISAFANSVGANVVLGPESRGFIFGCPVAYKNKIGFVPVRKPGKLPRKTIQESYDLEYGSNTLCIHEDAIKEGDKVIIIDDLLATGGTLEAAVKLVNKCKAEVVGIACVIELVDLNGREKIKNINVKTLIEY